MKKTLVAAALVASMSLVAVACNDSNSTPEPTTPAEAVESMAADAVDAAESMAADAVDAVESMSADAEEAAESDVQEAAEASPEA